jgi:hypothetical protein
LVHCIERRLIRGWALIGITLDNQRLLPIGADDQQVSALSLVKSPKPVRPDLDLDPATEACGLAAGSLARLVW